MKVFFYLFLIFFISSAQAVSYTTQYEANGLGLTLLSADMTLDLTDKSYQVQTKSQARGMVSLFIHAQSLFETRGLIRHKQLIVEESVMQNKDAEKTQTTVNHLMEKKGYIDYQSVLIELIRQKQPHTQTFLVSDGKRDMEITLIYEGQKDIAHQTKNKNHSVTDVYGVRVHIISGKKKGWFFKRIQAGKTSPLKLYFHYDEQIKMPVLVMGSFDTGVLGTLYIIQKECIYGKTQSENK